MSKLPARWARHLESGVSHRLGACAPGGRPEICRALAARASGDGCVEVLLAADVGQRVMDAALSSQRVAHVAARLGANVALQTLGHEVQVLPAHPEHLVLVMQVRDRFADALEPFGMTRERLSIAWYDVDLPMLRCLSFRLLGAWDQTPGNGGPIELQP